MKAVGIDYYGVNSLGCEEKKIELVHCPKIGNVVDERPNFPKESCEMRQRNIGSRCYRGCKYVNRNNPEKLAMLEDLKKPKTRLTQDGGFTPPPEWMRELKSLCRVGISGEHMAKLMGCSVSSVNKWSRQQFKGEEWDKIKTKRQQVGGVFRMIKMGKNASEIVAKTGYRMRKVREIIDKLQVLELIDLKYEHKE